VKAKSITSEKNQRVMADFVNADLEANSGEWAEPSPQNLKRGIWNLFFCDVITALPHGKPGT